MGAATWGLLIAVFLACVVEMVEATTIVLAIGLTRGWRPTLAGVGAAIVALAAVTSAAGYALTRWLPESALQLLVGALLLIFGLQWLRKAILRSSGRKAEHDEDQIFRDEVGAAESAGPPGSGPDLFAFLVSFKGVFLEGMEVVFIVITFGLNDHNVPAAAVGAAVAVVVVLGIAAALRRPLAMIPENLLKYGVGLLLATFGTYWSVAGVGVFRAGRVALRWPGHDLAVLALLVAWFALSQLLIAALRVPGSPPRPAAAADPHTREVAR